jgi:hypothetical protein
MWLNDTAEALIPAVLIGGVAAYWVAIVRRAAHHERAAHKEHTRAIRGHYAAVEAGEDAPEFAPEAIEVVVAQIVALADSVWGHTESSKGTVRPDANIVRAWAWSWSSRLGKELSADGTPSVDVLHLINRHDEDEDRVVLRVRLHIHCSQPTWGQHNAHCDERWTLGRRGPDWQLLSVSGDPLAGPVLHAPFVTDPSADTERLTEESLAELSMADKISSGFALSELVPVEEPPPIALADLSVVDPRFTPSLLGAALTHLLESWEMAVTGSEEPLAERASVESRDALLRPDANHRLFVRDVTLTSWEVIKLQLDRTPPAVDVELQVVAVRYIVAGGSAIRAGNTTEPCPMTLAWTLEFTGSTEVPWRLVSANDPATDIDGFG